MRREEFAAEGAKVPRFSERVDASGNPSPPPPPWFTFVAGLVPAIPVACFIPLSTILILFPVWVAVFYVPNPIPAVSPMLILCLMVTYYALSEAGWSGVLLLLLSALLGFLLNLAESAFWDTLEPFLVGQPGFGAGHNRVRPEGQAAKRAAHGAAVATATKKAS